MTSSPDEIRREIEQTRRELATDVDTLHEKVSPTAVASRKVQSAKGAVSSIKDMVMGSAGSAGQSTSGGMSAVGDTVSSAPSMARDRARGNPMAAGVIAFGAGWLISSLLPASEKEKQAAMQVKDKASEHSETLMAPMKHAAEEMKDNLKEPAQQAADSVKSTATDAASTVQDTAKSAKDDVAGQAQDAKDQMASDGSPGKSSDLNAPAWSSTGGRTT